MSLKAPPDAQKKWEKRAADMRADIEKTPDVCYRCPSCGKEYPPSLTGKKDFRGHLARKCEPKYLPIEEKK